ncbi:protein kinase [Pendulispora rubella]|uniref:Protein kinase n=1 Tax=Pendulispora rubella TaxID=2741070 RepID=A0ABZ2KQU3_9BACT
MELEPVFAGRFVIEELAGTGGMGVVYRARDRQRDGATVALKVLASSAYERHLHERFTREANVLAQLHHPGIVSYVDHGTTPHGEAYLVMEWLEGEDLDQRLARRDLSLPETVNLFRQIADALSAAHRHGIVHRDLKPRNIFLVGGNLDQVSLLDFGVARLVSSELTAHGLAVGTPLYMAPEQARGDRNVGPSADVFTLGSVMFECLTGRSPFSGENTPLVMANIMRREAPRLRTLRPAMPKDVEDLLARMLSKDPTQRPKDACALLCDLLALGPIPDVPDALGSAEPPPTTLAAPASRPLLEEQQLVSVVMSVNPNARRRPFRVGDEELTSPSPRATLADAVRGRFGARVDLLLDGTMTAILAKTERMTATEQAVQAARCALFVREIESSFQVAVTTGRAVVRAHMPSGEALDRARTFLRTVARIETAPSGVWIDDVTAQLLDARFQTGRAASGFRVVEEEILTDEARPLLGKPTPCVGRDRELALLRMLLSECCEEPVARLAVVTAAAGIGKSRLRREFLRQVHSDDRMKVETLVGHSDPTRAGAPYGILWDAFRRLIGVRDGEDVSLQQNKLRERVGRHVPAGKVQFASEFIGELCGIHFPSEASPRLQDARSQPHSMFSHVSEALITFFRAESHAHPVVLVLEDLQWSDVLTVRAIDMLLRDCGDEPIMVLALARPEVDELFPKLWSERKRQDFRLDGLTKKASTQLVATVLGEDVEPAAVPRIVDQAAGNALFLEELIRFVASGGAAAMPATVLAMLQARLKRLDPDLRRVLRAASIFGGRFWRGGIVALLGGDDSPGSMDGWLRALVDQELIVLDSSGRFLGDIQYSFRHELVREAAHSMLTDADRVAGHRAAARFLESMGERNPRVLAEHFALGDMMARASKCYTKAAIDAFDHGDIRAVIPLTESAIACGAEGELLGISLAVRGRAHALDCEWDEAPPLLARALPLLSRGSRAWYMAAGMMLLGAGVLVHPDEVSRWGEELWAAPCESKSAVARLEAGWLAVGYSARAGARSQAERHLAKMDEHAASITSLFGKGLWKLARAEYAWYLRPEPWTASMAAAEAEGLFEAGGHHRLMAFAQIYRGISLAHLGNIDAGEQKLRAALAEARRSRELWLISNATPYLAMVLLEKGNAASVDEAERLLRAFLDQPGEKSYRGLANAVLAEILLLRGDLASAEKHARLGVGMITAFVIYRAHANAVLTKVLQHSHRLVEACKHIDAALEACADEGCGFMEVRLWLEAFDAYAAAKNLAAMRALEGAVKRVRDRAEHISDADVRMRYLTKNAVNRRVLEEAETHPNFATGRVM